MRYPILAALLLVSIATFLPAQTAPAPAPLQGKIDAVTVYRGQALVTRLVDVAGPVGLREVVVSDLPARIVPGSLYAESADGAEVRSVLYRERAVGQDIREEVRKLDEQIRGVQDQVAANQRESQLLAEQKEYLAKLEQFVAPTAQAELSKGVLNAETIKGLTTFQFEQRKTIAMSELKLAKDARDLAEQLNTLQRQREQITGGSSRTVREAVVFANFPGTGGKLRVRYLVSDATWFPSYNVRAESGAAKQVNVEFNASIQQSSGEDWSDVQMTLSTATPSLVAMAPVLDPLAIALAPAGTAPKSDAMAMGYAGAKKQLEERRVQIDNTRLNAVAQRAAVAGDSLDKGLNDVATEMQVLEILAKDARDREAKPGSGFAGFGPGKADEGVSVTYSLASRTSLPSRSDTQLIQIASTPMKAEFFKLAVPVLTSYVYEQAAVTNDGKMVLLAGPVASYVAGQFVGSGQIPTIAVGETFTAGFGIDSSLRASRELVDKSETTQGGNKVVTFNYRLSVENFGTSATTVRLTDRLPTSKDDGIKVTLGTMTKDISNDVTYQQTDRKKGLLRWDVEVPPQSMGTKAVIVDYQYKLEYDKQMTIAGMVAGK